MPASCTSIRGRSPVIVATAFRRPSYVHKRREGLVRAMPGMHTALINEQAFDRGFAPFVGLLSDVLALAVFTCYACGLTSHGHKQDTLLYIRLLAVRFA